MNKTALGVVAGVLIGATGVAPTSAIAASPAKAVASNPWAAVTAAMMPDAIRAIEQATAGRVLEIRFRMWRGAVGFIAVVGKPDDTISHVSIAIPDLRVVVIAEADIPDWMAPWTVRADKKSIWKAKIPLADAVGRAEEMVGGVAVDADVAKPLTGDNAVLAYNVEIVKDGRPQRIVIDAETGQTIADPEPLLEAWKPEDALMRSLHMTP
jgi:hypothetical protein